MSFIRKRGKIYYCYWYENGKQKSVPVSPDLQSAKIYKANRDLWLYANKNGLPLKNYPFQLFINEYLKEYTAFKAQRTQIRDNSIIQLFKQNCPGIYYTDQFDDQALKIYISARQNQNIKASSINRELGLLKHMQKIAYQKHYISDDISKNTHFIQISKNKTEYPVTDDDIQRLFDYIKEPYKTACILGYAHGLRRGEVCHLELSDFDFNKNIIKIRNKPHLNWQTKNESSVRDVPIHPQYKKYIQKRHKQALKKKAKTICFFDDDSRSLDEDVLTGMFRKFKKHLKIDHKFNFHSLRHKFITLALNQNPKFKQVSNIVGHSTIKVTEAVYYHSTNKENQNVMQTLKFPLNIKK